MRFFRTGFLAMAFLSVTAIAGGDPELTFNCTCSQYTSTTPRQIRSATTTWWTGPMAPQLRELLGRMSADNRKEVDIDFLYSVRANAGVEAIFGPGADFLVETAIVGGQPRRRRVEELAAIRKMNQLCRDMETHNMRYFGCRLTVSLPAL